MMVQDWGSRKHSHRSELATNILNATKAGLAKYLDIPDSYEVLLMHGGRSGQFSATVSNFVSFWVEKKRQQILESLSDSKKPSSDTQEAASELLQKAVREELKVDYSVTGSWSLKASQEAARLLGQEHVNIVADARETNGGKFGIIPDHGVEFPEFPDILVAKPGEVEPIVVADMSSNILSRRIPVKNFSAIFFGAQKNLGTTGITVVIIKKSLLPPTLATSASALLRQLRLPVGPIVLDYAITAKNNSLYNTLSIFDVYIAGLVVKQLLDTFSDQVDGQEKLVEKKVAVIYAALEAHPKFYKVVPDKTVRSRMNICFRCLSGDETEKAFLKGATSIGLLGLKDHRSVGGIRASNYNSVSLEGAQKLATYLQDFATAK